MSRGVAPDTFRWVNGLKMSADVNRLITSQIETNLFGYESE